MPPTRSPVPRLLMGLAVVLSAVAAAPAHAAPAADARDHAVSRVLPPEPDAGLRKVNEIGGGLRLLLPQRHHHL